jgi:hypothetical protein
MAKSQVRIEQTKIDFKDAVRAATTANIADLAAGAPDTIDGVSLVAGDRVLVRAQTTASENGIYIVDTLGTGVNGAWSRVLDMESGDIVEQGLMVFVADGIVSARVGYMLDSSGTAGAHTVGTTLMTFTALSDSNTGVPAADHVYNEVPSGAIDGSNTTFTTASGYTTGKLRVYLNGLRQLLTDEWSETTPASGTFDFVDAPKSSQGNPDVVTVDYLK